jgi:hypothetical protein
MFRNILCILFSGGKGINSAKSDKYIWVRNTLRQADMKKQRRLPIKKFKNFLL